MTLQSLTIAEVLQDDDEALGIELVEELDVFVCDAVALFQSREGFEIDFFSSSGSAFSS